MYCSEDFCDTTRRHYYADRRKKGPFITDQRKLVGAIMTNFSFIFQQKMPRRITFPFKEQEEVSISIENKKLVVAKIEKKKTLQ